MNVPPLLTKSGNSEEEWDQGGCTGWETPGKSVNRINKLLLYLLVIFILTILVILNINYEQRIERRNFQIIVSCLIAFWLNGKARRSWVSLKSHWYQLIRIAPGIEISPNGVFNNLTYSDCYNCMFRFFFASKKSTIIFSWSSPLARNKRDRARLAQAVSKQWNCLSQRCLCYGLWY